MKEQQKRKIQQFHPEIEDGTDLRRWPLLFDEAATQSNHPDFKFNVKYSQELLQEGQNRTR